MNENQKWWVDSDMIYKISSVNNKKECLIAASNSVAYVYTSKSDPHLRVIFLCNLDTNNALNITFEDNTYDLPANSVSIINNEGVELYNTAKINSQGLPTQREYRTIFTGENDINWQHWSEMIPFQNAAQMRTDTFTHHLTPLVCLCVFVCLLVWQNITN